MKTNLISIIMPAYNMEKFIGESIESVLAQTYTHWELLIVDDGSTDSTKEICHQYMLKDDRIKYLYEENGKQGKARNTGIKASVGDIISFLDADDIWKMNFLEKQINLLESSTYALVFSNIEYIDAQSKRIEEEHQIEFEILKGREGIAIMLAKNPVPMSTVMARKKAILEVGGFKESKKLQHGEDYELWIQLLIHGFVLKGNNESLVYYRKHPWQSTAINDSKYDQRIHIIQNIPSNQKLEKEKKEAISRWLLRKLIVSKKPSKTDLLKDADFMPSVMKKKVSKMACHLFPAKFSRKVMCFFASN
ncbi:MAG: glycosyltransferase family 2 protein [Bacteroidetes bacterium]|nr:glycosyltransferase family 2 protein [Bacteroidota bacterium]